MKQSDIDILKILALKEAEDLEKDHPPEWIDGFRTGYQFLADYINASFSTEDKIKQ